ncbi:hypothetical protein PFISCL1PPCAC_27134, partial [Pristionchus fissidentatus]
FLFLFFLIGFVSSAPVETSTEIATEATTISWVSNADVRKHIDLINEFVRVREEAGTPSTESVVDNEMIPISELNESSGAVQSLIHQLFAMNKDIEKKKKEYEMMTTTTVAPTAAPTKGFFGKLFQSTPLRKLFD